MPSPKDRSSNGVGGALRMILRIVLTLMLGTVLLSVVLVAAVFGLGMFLSHKNPDSGGQIVLFFSVLGGFMLLLVGAIFGIWVGPWRRRFGAARPPSGTSPD